MYKTKTGRQTSLTGVDLAGEGQKVMGWKKDHEVGERERKQTNRKGDKYAWPSRDLRILPPNRDFLGEKKRTAA